MYAYGSGSWGAAGGLGVEVELSLRCIGGVGGGIAESAGTGAACGNISDGHVALMTGLGIAVIEWLSGFIVFSSTCVMLWLLLINKFRWRLPMNTFW